MTSKTQCIKIFNCSITGTPISYANDIIPLISDYLTEINCEKSDKIISLIVSNPSLCDIVFPKVMKYFILKYCILSIMFNNKTIMYYE